MILENKIILKILKKSSKINKILQIRIKEADLISTHYSTILKYFNQFQLKSTSLSGTVLPHTRYPALLVG